MALSMGDITENFKKGLSDMANTLTSGLGAMLSGTGTSGFSDSSGQTSSSNHSESTGSSSSNAWSTSSSTSSAKEDSVSDSYSTTFGREASAEDIERAKEANAEQQRMWEQQAQFNSQEAEKDRMFQAAMANTSYQRVVKDMIAAGLNPMLAVQNGGAATPTGAMASSGLAQANKATTYAQQESRSHSESHGTSSSQSKSKSRSSSESKQEAYSEGYSQGSNSAHSETTNNMREFINNLNGLLNGGSSGKSQSSDSTESKKGGKFNGHGASR